MTTLRPGAGPRIALELAQEFARTAVARDQRGGTPKAERDLLRQSGLLSLTIPDELGGVGASWQETLEVVRILSRADSSLGHVFGFHHLMLATVRLFAAREQWTRLLAASHENNWFWGNALNPLDTRTTLQNGPEGLRIDGEKSFCSGSVDAEMLIVSALRPPNPRLAIFALPASRPGIHVLADWDNMGQRQTDSGGVVFRAVKVDESELLDTPGPLGSVFASLRSCIAQLILGNVFLGIAEGAFEEARSYTASSRRAWSGSGVASAREDPYVLAHYGEMRLGLESARLFTDHAAIQLDRAWALGDDLSAEQRGATALAVAQAKVATTRVGLDVTNRMFEVMGARATVASAGADRFWRNLRTHTLHDPVDYKLRELGEFALNGKLATPGFYS
jgi:alkylation response protein AidB-like acyl-CoA dehydrogenase